MLINWPLGSEVDVGKELDLRMEGRRRRVGGADDEDASVGLDEADGIAIFGSSRDPVRSLSLRILGLGGGLSPASPPCSCSSPSKSNILQKFSPTLGELSNSFVSCGGAGVASVSPVAVRTTPFIAETMTSSKCWRVAGVVRVGKR